MKNRGEILCTDSNEKRLPRLDENLTNLGVDIASVRAFDWTHQAPDEWHGLVDAILLDVPCSNTGVLRRRVDARWRLRAEHITDLCNIQYSILENALQCLRDGGRIVYSTCSIEPDENNSLIEKFISEHLDWQLTKSHQALPFRDNTDGAYAARIERV